MTQATSTISSKGQVTIPAEIRRCLGAKPADNVSFVIDAAGNVELRPAPTVESIRGIIPALPDREAGDFREQSEDGIEEAATRIVRDMSVS